jgi:hypothetical protein
MIKIFQKETKSISRSINVNNLYKKIEILRKIMNIHEYANELICIILLQFLKRAIHKASFDTS